MKFKLIKLFSFLIILLSCNIAFAQKDKKAEEINGIRSEIIVQIDEAEKKYTALIEATPQDKFSWRPEKGVRSISEVFMHVAYGNYLITGKAGAKTPKDLSNAMEKISDKKKVAEKVKKSFEFAREAVINTKESELDDEIDFFGRKTTKRGVLYFLTIHINQHLGQSIAYSRSVGIVPPWSAG